MAMLVSYRPLAHNHSRRVLLDVPRDKTQTLRPRRRGNLLGRHCGRQAHLFHMSRFSSDLPLEVTSGLQRLVSIVDEQRPSGTPAALQALNFDFSSISGIEVLRGVLRGMTPPAVPQRDMTPTASAYHATRRRSSVCPRREPVRKSTSDSGASRRCHRRGSVCSQTSLFNQQHQE